MVYPQVGEVFELEIDGNASENTPSEIIRSFGYNPNGWKFSGPVVMGKKSCQVMLVQIGNFQQKLDEIKRMLEAKYGPMPGGQFVKVFKDACPEPDGKGPVGIADSQWLDPSGDALFPCINSFGRSYFGYPDFGFSVSWRWLVSAAPRQ
ncbi:MAG: hypothetical protein Q7K65_05140 [Candidatus Buchananbacteria bacterium]|nr:hypothetical protein [Candidatus Buchananbacteria bacterium]